MKLSAAMTSVVLGMCWIPADAAIIGLTVDKPRSVQGSEISVKVASDGDQSICSFRISFGDGGDSLVLVDPFSGTFPRTSRRAYSRPGNYVITVKGEGSGLHPACEGEAGALVTVRPAQANLASARAATRDALVAFAQDGDVKRALHAYQLALDIDPGYAAAHFGMGVVLEAARDWDAARRAFSYALLNAGSTPLAAAAREQLQQVDDAQKLEAAASGAQQREYDLLITRARLQMNAKPRSDDEATRLARRAAEIDDGRWPAHAILGEIALRSSRWAEAVSQLRAAASRAPKPQDEALMAQAERAQQVMDSAESVRRAKAQLQQGSPAQVAEAARALQAAFELDADDLQLGLSAAMAQAKSGDLSAAERLMEQMRPQLAKTPAAAAANELSERLHAQRLAAERERAGLFAENLPPQLMARLGELAASGKRPRSVAITRASDWVIVTPDGDLEASPHFPSNIRQRAAQWRSEGKTIAWVNVGGDGEAVMASVDGNGSQYWWWWSPPRDFEQKVNEYWTKEYLRYAAFTKAGGYAFVRSEYGFWSNNVPQPALDNLWADFYDQERNRSHFPVRQVEFGFNGEHVMLVGDFGYWCQGVPQSMSQTLARLNAARRIVRLVALAPNGGWLVLADPVK